MVLVRRISLLAATAAAVVAPLSAAAAASQPRRLKPQARYAGRSSQQRKVSLELSGDTHRIAWLYIRWLDRCSDGHRYAAYTEVSNVALRRGSFHDHGSYTSGGASDTFTLRGSVARNSAGGSFSLRARGTNAEGSEVTCSTGRISWRAALRRR